MNKLIRVVTRRRINRLLSNGLNYKKLEAVDVINHVVEETSTKAAKKLLRKQYGHLALFGIVRSTNLEPGIYFPQEKQLVRSCL